MSKKLGVIPGAGICQKLHIRPRCQNRVLRYASAQIKPHTAALWPRRHVQSQLTPQKPALQRLTDVEGWCTIAMVGSPPTFMRAVGHGGPRLVCWQLPVLANRMPTIAPPNGIDLHPAAAFVCRRKLPAGPPAASNEAHPCCYLAAGIKLSCPGVVYWTTAASMQASCRHQAQLAGKARGRPFSPSGIGWGTGRPLRPTLHCPIICTGTPVFVSKCNEPKTCRQYHTAGSGGFLCACDSLMVLSLAAGVSLVVFRAAGSLCNYLSDVTGVSQLPGRQPPGANHQGDALLFFSLFGAAEQGSTCEAAASAAKPPQAAQPPRRCHCLAFEATRPP